MVYLLSIVLIFNLPFQTKTMPTNDEIVKQISENRKILESTQSKVILSPSRHSRYPTKNRSWFKLIDEDFESGMPAGWTVTNGDGDSYTWGVGTFGLTPPPNYGTSYCWYNDDVAGEFNISGDSIQTPILGIPDSITSLSLSYGYGHTIYQGESLKVQVRYHDGVSWGGWQQLRGYGVNVSGRDSVVLDENNDSLQVMWLYRDDHTLSSWGWGSSFDNVLIEYFIPVEKDAGMYAINSPVSDTTGSFVSVNGTVQNYGIDTFSFKTYVNIYDPDLLIAFSDSSQVDSLAPSDTLNIGFGSFQLTKGGTYTVEMFTYELDDANPWNDSLTTTFNSSDLFWQSLPSPGIRNNKHAVVYDPVNDLFFLTGGDSTGSDDIMDICLSFDPKTNTWDTKQPMPIKRERHRAGYRNGFIHVLCGMDESGTKITNHSVYDIGSNSWDTAAPSPLTVTRPCVVTWRDSLVYLIGGYDENSDARTDVYFYEAVTNSWNTATSLPRRIHGGGAEIRGDSIVIVGGCDGLACFSDMLIGEINPANPTEIGWFWGPSLPIPENGNNMHATKNNKVYMIGGFYNDGINDVWEFDVQDASWTSLPDYPTSVIAVGDFADSRNGPDTAGIVYCFMGDTSDFWSRTPTNECYRLTRIHFSGIEEEITPKKNSISLNSAINLTGEIVINFNIRERCDLNINMYDVLGRQVFSHSERSANNGSHQFTINKVFKNGIYFIRMEAGATVALEKVILIR